MAPVGFVCEACGDVLAVLDNTGAEPALRLTAGLVFRAGGGASCPGCGHDTKINFSALGKLIPGDPKAN